MPVKVPLWVWYSAVCFLLLLISLVLKGRGEVSSGILLTIPETAVMKYLDDGVKLITSLNIAILGAAGALAVKGSDWSVAWHRTDSFIVAGLVVFVGTSYYGIYMQHVSIAAMAFSGFFDLFEGQLQTGVTLAYYGMLTGVFLLGLIFTRMLDGRKPAS